jgi:ketosteroid isomerase-like protein
MWPYHSGPIERAHFVEAVARVNADFEFLEADIHEFLIDGDCAALHVTFTTRNRGAGSPAEVDVWMHLRFLNDLVVEAAIYVDVARAAGLLPGGMVEIHASERARGASRAAPAGAAVKLDLAAAGATERAECKAPEARSREWMQRVAHDFFALRAKGDFPGMLARLAPDFVYNPRGTWTRLPLMVDACDRAAFAESLRLVNVEFEDLGGEVHELLVDGDRVVAHRTIRIRNRGAGDVVHLDEWVCLRILDGLIVEMASYVDNARAAGVVWPAYTPPR